MIQEQREHVEEMLICMLEKAHSQFTECLVGDNSPLMGAAAELAQTLVVLDESAPVFPLKARVGGNTIDTTSPVREIKAELPDKEELTADEAWELVEKAIRNSHAHAHAAAAEFGKLPPLVRKAVGRPEQLWDWYLVLDKWRDEVESNFREAFRSVTEPENRCGGQERRIVVKGVVHIDTTELDAALVKLERLEEILNRIKGKVSESKQDTLDTMLKETLALAKRVVHVAETTMDSEKPTGGTESQPERDATQEDMDRF